MGQSDSPSRRPAAASGDAMPRDAALRGRSPERASDIAHARTIATAVLAVPGVVALSPGRTALLATYASGQHVAGVVVQHRPSDLNKLLIEIHVVLSQEYCERAAAAAARGNVEEPSSITQVANHIREAASASFADVPSPALDRIDVVIDDLR
jgi:hypothetical protein